MLLEQVETFLWNALGITGIFLQNIFPDMPALVVGNTTATSISLSWSVPSGSEVDSYEVMWQRDTSGECPDEDMDSVTVSGITTSYTITDLEENSNYSIILRAVNMVGSAHSNTTTATTLDSGIYRYTHSNSNSSF